MANCDLCGSNLELVGRVHRCVPVDVVVVNSDIAAAEGNGSTYRYRDAAARRAYMRDYMRKRRGGADRGAL